MNHKDYTMDQQNINETINTYLDSLSDTALREIINQEDQETLIEELSQKCSAITKLKKEKDMLFAKNKNLAEQNYKREPQYNDLRKVLEEAHKQSVELKQQLFEKQQKLNKLKPKMTPDTLRSLLQVAAQESEEQSEEIAKQYLSGDKTYEEFIKEFIKKRTEYHERRIKYEKLIDSIQNPSSISNNNSSLNNQINSNSNLSNLSSSNIPSNLNPLPYPQVPTSIPPFAYQPFNTSLQPIRSAPLPPHMQELPPYPTTPYNPPNQFTSPQSSNLPSYPFNQRFNMNPNYR